MSAFEQLHGGQFVVDELDDRGWTAICPVQRLTPDRGVAALIEDTPVAVFLIAGGALHAIDNIDPISGASILSRGLIGDVDGVATVASPMFKQRFELLTGRCVDLDDVRVRVHEVYLEDGQVHVRLAREP